MTVYKPIQQEADALATLAVALVKGEQPQVDGKAQDPEGNREVPAVLLEPIPIFKDNVKQVVDDGFVTGCGDLRRRGPGRVHRARHLDSVRIQRGARRSTGAPLRSEEDR